MNNNFIVVMEKQYIGYPLYKQSKCKLVEPYILLNKTKIGRKIRAIIINHSSIDLIGVNKELQHINEGTVLMYDGTAPKLVEYIRNYNPRIRIIVYYINPVKYSIQPDQYLIYNCELWTFDDEDALKFNMHWNPLHYFGTTINQSAPKDFDVSFVGADKGRYDKIQKLEKKFIELGIKPNFIITSGTNTPFYDRKKYKKRMSYSANLDIMMRSKAILDLLQPEQYGYTMRIPESMVNHVKLITNNTNIYKYRFYNKDNIFVLGRDDLNQLKQFINSPWNHDNDKAIQDLQYDYWIKQFHIV